VPGRQGPAASVSISIIPIVRIAGPNSGIRNSSRMASTLSETGSA
jgi:hypothetical protein